MNTTDIIRAWKDAEYRESLSDAQRAALPENPVGLIEIPTAALAGIAGGKPINRPVTQVRCPSHRPQQPASSSHRLARRPQAPEPELRMGGSGDGGSAGRAVGWEQYLSGTAF